ncbi:MAG: hypothetical protein GF408_07510 [Candidatus Omnitrophica bacterium]|nr:hypothetical protein [Candidatus Omnitrophota bacterium]
MNVFIGLVVIWLIVYFLFRRDLKSMGGKVPRVMGPFTLPRMLDDYYVLCDRAGRKPVFFYLVYSLFFAILIYVIGNIIYGVMR